MDLFLRVIAETAGSDDPRIRVTGLGFAALILLGMALRVYTLRKAEEDKRLYNEALAAMPEGDRQLLKKPKGVPPEMHVVGAILLEQNDEWAVSRRYMSLETLAGLCDDPAVRSKAIAPV